MSVGQQQRVAVARALVCDPAVVLADEPTASLDPSNAMAAMELIQTLCKERNAALLCVSHDPAMASRFEHRTTLEALALEPIGSAGGGTLR
jgi:ABC-type lipoprotein export system ATPase subunit